MKAGETEQTRRSDSACARLRALARARTCVCGGGSGKNALRSKLGENEEVAVRLRRGHEAQRSRVPRFVVRLAIALRARAEW